MTHDRELVCFSATNVPAAALRDVLIVRGAAGSLRGILRNPSISMLERVRAVSQKNVIRGRNQPFAGRRPGLAGLFAGGFAGGFTDGFDPGFAGELAAGTYFRSSSSMQMRKRLGEANRGSSEPLEV